MENPSQACNCTNEEEHAYFIILVRLFLDYIEKREIVVDGNPNDYHVLVEKFSKIAETEKEYFAGVNKTNELLDIWDEYGLDLKSDLVQDAIIKTGSILPIVCLLLEHAEKYKIKLPPQFTDIFEEI